MGVSITATAGVISHITGRVQMLSTGLPCLTCTGALDAEQIRQEMLTPEQRRADPYVQGHHDPQPAVVSLNSTVASLAVTMFMGAVTAVPAAARFRSTTACAVRRGTSPLRGNPTASSARPVVRWLKVSAGLCLPDRKRREMSDPRNEVCWFGAAPSPATMREFCQRGRVVRIGDIETPLEGIERVSTVVAYFDEGSEAALSLSLPACAFRFVDFGARLDIVAPDDGTLGRIQGALASVGTRKIGATDAYNETKSYAEAGRRLVNDEKSSQVYVKVIQRQTSSTG